jgi:hypothetical protein
LSGNREITGGALSRLAENNQKATTRRFAPFAQNSKETTNAGDHGLKSIKGNQAPDESACKMLAESVG